MMLASFSQTSVAAWRRCSPPQVESPAAARRSGSAVADQAGEAELYRLWERCAGRQAAGTGGTYLILDPGQRNGGPGPDYRRAAIRFPDGTVRRGEVEIHTTAAGWKQHRHATDFRYSRLLAQVVGWGPLPAVTTAGGDVPTLRLPALSGPALRPCEVGTIGLSAAATTDMLQLLAGQRWFRRLAVWQGLDRRGELVLLAERLGSAGAAAALLDAWQRELPGAAALDPFLEALGYGKVADEKDVARRTQRRRARLLSALAWRTRGGQATPDVPDNWGAAGWTDLTNLLKVLQGAGYRVPGHGFCVEVAGNWLLPRQAARSGAERFQAWFDLPRGFLYGRVQRLADRLGQPRPRSFGEQQGWLEWLVTLCGPGDCSRCPVTG